MSNLSKNSDLLRAQTNTFASQSIVPVGAQTFAGTDVSVIFDIPLDSPHLKAGDSFKVSQELQTLTISSASSILPVRVLGHAKPRAYTKGARSFAGTMIFTVINKDPFQELFAVDALNNSVVNDRHWFIDQMPPFDAIIVAQNEMGGVGIQIIHNILISHWGTTYSVDDVFTESSYAYIAEHVTPFIYNPINTTYLYGVIDLLLKHRGVSSPKTPDEISDLVADWTNRNIPNGLTKLSNGKANSSFDWYDKANSNLQSSVNGLSDSIRSATSGGKILISNLLGANTYVHKPVVQYYENSLDPSLFG